MKFTLIVACLFLAYAAEGQNNDPYKIIKDFIIVQQTNKINKYPIYVNPTCYSIFKDKRELTLFKKEWEFYLLDTSLISDLTVDTGFISWDKSKFDTGIRITIDIPDPNTSIMYLNEHGKKTKETRNPPISYYEFSKPIFLKRLNYCLIRISANGGNCIYLMRSDNWNQWTEILKFNCSIID